MNQVVVETLQNRLASEGRVTFAEFMGTALYHPTAGYYNRQEMTIGEGGDFYTSPMVHPIFGACIARQVFQLWVELGRPASFMLLEMGAGVGQLAVDLLRTVAGANPGFFAAIQYVIVEQGAHLRERQKSNLHEHGFTEKVTWYETLDEVPGQGEREGVILSNELFDALPVHRLGKSGDGFVEYYVVADGAGFAEEPGPLSDPKLADLVDEDTKAHLPEGERVAVCPAAVDVLQAMGRLLNRGFVMTIDYGNLAPDVHLQHKQADGVRGYYYQKLTQPLQYVGQQDLTADVDFSLLIRSGEKVGLHEVGFTTQMKLLGGNGFLQKVQELRNKRFDLMADAELYRMLNLFLPQSLGDVFKVLFQAKGVSTEGLSGRLNALAFTLDE
ncbi:SAM-dependent methyltransferase [Tumebacillus sp. ITR2]|uniref:SAM-dependent methyltransferase n=1 Tax=Tumebacillus amylolyticus TaxID=2801339 RepID=A0ABS1J886_9BACL|nr:SAM-dependent methyltransferase [Tumebacillus amylolyticus]MBL0386405.1 SAM-dependent methyltransferase [Tumebacillus amylolyticus]